MKEHGPLVVMTRAPGATGWTVHVDASSVRLGDFELAVKGARIEKRGAGKPSRIQPGEQFKLNGLDVVCFRAEEQSRTQPTPAVMKAIEAVRASDTDDARRVLSDVLEESGAVAEAEYVRLELKLQQFRDAKSTGFLEGVRELRVLSSVVGPTFRYLVGRDVDGCAGVRWAFRCPASWDEMQTTQKPDERVCVSCRQLVVQVTSEAEAAKLAREGVCAQVRVEEEMWVGEMAAPEEQPSEPEHPRMWVGSVAVRPPPHPIEPRRPAVEPSKPPQKPWWKKLFGR